MRHHNVTLSLLAAAAVATWTVQALAQPPGGGRDGGSRGGFGGHGGPGGGMQPPWGWGGRGGGDPERQKLMEEIFKLDRESYEVSKKYRDAKEDDKRAELKKQLEELLNKVFDLKQAAQEKEVARLEKQLSELRDTVAARKKDKSEIIKSRFDKLTAKTEAHDW